MSKEYSNEIEMYPDIVNWLKPILIEKFKSASKIIVLDTHDSDLSNFIIKLNYTKYFPEYSTYNIRQDITGFIEYRGKVDLVFIECKNTRLNLIHLSQLIGYSFIANPIHSFLISPKGLGASLHKLLFTYNRADILEYRPNKKISVLKWNKSKKDIDNLGSIFNQF